MAVLNSEHLFEQAEKLIAAPPAGPPRQADLRRAISAAYYAVFHATLTQAADLFVGRTKRSESRYGLVYRSIGHKQLRELCEIVRKQKLSARYVPHAPASGFGPNIPAFAAAFIELQEKRHSADYDPLFRVNLSEALLLVRIARAAVARFQRASPASRKAFLSLLLFPPRLGA